MQSRIDYLLHLADNALILGHRNSEWCGHGPILEQDIAISNIALDLIGQARMLYQHAAELINNSASAPNKVSSIEPLSSINYPLSPIDEDSLAYLRNPSEFRNCLLVEQPNGDWAVTIVRQFFISVYQQLLYQQLQHSSDGQLSAIAVKSLKEVIYHVKWSSEWVIRLGDGTGESHQRIKEAVHKLLPWTAELFVSAPYEQEGVAAGWSVAAESLQNPWIQQVANIFNEATLEPPLPQSWHKNGGKTGAHSEYLSAILEEMQFMQRTYPGSEW